MLDIEIVSCTDVERASSLFQRDGLVALSGTLSCEQLTRMQAGAARVVREQGAVIPMEEANRGYARYSFGEQIHEPEWQMLVDLPTTLPILEAIFGSDQFTASGGGGDYSHPGAEIQFLHSDMSDMLKDPLGQVTVFDLPTPFVVINFLMTDFNEVTGATRFVPGTHRTRVRPPALEDEPAHWKNSIICAPAGTAIVRDVRTWHGGTANRSDGARIMVSAGYYAPWFKRGPSEKKLPRAAWEGMSERARFLCGDLVHWE